MRLVFKSVHIHKEFLKARLDFMPEITDVELFRLHNVMHYDVNDNELGVWTNPCLCHFITIPESVDKEDIDEFVNKLIDRDLLASLKEALVRPDAAHYISPLMRNRTLSYPKISAGDTRDLIATVNSRLSGKVIDLGNGGGLTRLARGSIDIGSAAIDRPYSTGGANAYIDKTNPANASGTIDTWQIYCAAVGDWYLGVATGSGTSWSANDYADVGEVASGSMQEYSGLSVTVVLDDCTCHYSYDNAGYIDANTSGGSGMVYRAGNPFGAGVQTWSNSSRQLCSLYGTGTEGGAVTYINRIMMGL